ncbi:MAG TPA: DUF418 domain-containing protein, partial [Caulobacteraceae bacterium]|nr:DUF418 domain-containing protein [Caulobacteraceae bacterium]
MAAAKAGDRYVSMDAVRGFAVLGILLMNIVGMGLPGYAYIDPTFYGGSEGANLWTWAANFVFTDGKMRALFTMLFGASILLISERAERGSGLSPAQTHYRRAVWLLLIGLIHGTVLWYGDILVFYAVAGMFAFPLRKLNARLLIGIGAAVYFGLMGWSLYEHAHLAALKAAAEAPGAAAATLEAFREASFALGPPPEFTQQALAGFGGGVIDVIKARSFMFMLMHVAISTTEYVEAFALILVGMGLFRLGFFTLKWPRRAYAAVIAVGYLIAAPITAWMAWRVASSGFDAMTIHEMNIWTAAPRLFIALAHASVVMLVVRAGVLRWLVDRLAAAGQMALTNYLMSSIIAVLVFDGWAFDLFGELQRYQLYFVVFGVWAAILLWSRP